MLFLEATSSTAVESSWICHLTSELLPYPRPRKRSESNKIVVLAFLTLDWRKSFSTKERPLYTFEAESLDLILQSSFGQRLEREDELISSIKRPCYS